MKDVGVVMYEVRSASAADDRLINEAEALKLRVLQ